ncbi:hypothetical protein BSL78_13992 [Apostichopus japonicus]|uniref:Uncharacterized protein n=1 Tax=Stichopus japonicus TaxID=307972 RepID=A0A2G8KMJ3_STIJA|nr:hypothetical protein BSL78_13992 [Apostichopus japonicus]
MSRKIWTSVDLTSKQRRPQILILRLKAPSTAEAKRAEEQLNLDSTTGSGSDNGNVEEVNNLQQDNEVTELVATMTRTSAKVSDNKQEVSFKPEKKVCHPELSDKEKESTTTKSSPNKEDGEPSASNSAVGWKTAHQSEQESGVGSDDPEKSDNGKGQMRAQTSPTLQEDEPSTSKCAVGETTTHQSEYEKGVGSDDATKSEKGRGPNSAQTPSTLQEDQPSTSKYAVGETKTHQSKEESGVESDDAQKSDNGKGQKSVQTLPTLQEDQPSTSRIAVVETTAHQSEQESVLDLICQEV